MQDIVSFKRLAISSQPLSQTVPVWPGQISTLIVSLANNVTSSSPFFVFVVGASSIVLVIEELIMKGCSLFLCFFVPLFEHNTW